MPENEKIPHVNDIKFGIIDKDFINTATHAANAFNDMKTQLVQAAHVVETPFGIPPFLAQLTGKEVHTTIDVEKLDGSTRTYEVAWKYTWSKVLVSAADGIIPPDANEAHDKDGDLNTEIVQQVEGDLAGFAWNICEMACELTKPIIFGVDLAGKDYPEGFIPYGAEEKEYVLMYLLHYLHTCFFLPNYVLFHLRNDLHLLHQDVRLQNVVTFDYLKVFLHNYQPIEFTSSRNCFNLRKL